MLAGWVWRDDGLDAAFCQPIAQAGRVVGSIGEQPAGRRTVAKRSRAAGEVVAVAGRDQERQRAAQIVGQRVDFGRAPAARATDRVLEGPPFAPAAER